MSSESRTSMVLVALVAIGAAAFLYNKQLNLEAERHRLAAQEKLQERRLKCAEDGWKFAEKYKAEEVSDVLPSHQFAWDDPVFHYSIELGTCLVRTRIVNVGYVTYQHARVTDLSSNTAVLESYVMLVQDPAKTDGPLKETLSDLNMGRPNMSRAEFVTRAEALMKK